MAIHLIVNKIKDFNEKYNFDLFFLFLFIVSLPIAHVTALQNISFLFFFIFSLLSLKKIKFNLFKEFNYFVIIIILFVFISFLSIEYSLFPAKVLSQIRAELIKPLLVLIVAFFFILNINKNRLKYVFFILLFGLFIHGCINLYLWNSNGFWPFRSGGLLDNGGGERFGIWATYSLSISIALFFTKYKKIAFLIFSIFLLSVIANNTRATFVGVIFILLSLFIYFYKNRAIKIIVIFMLFSIVVSFIYYSKNLNTRYNAYNIISSSSYFISYNPYSYKELAKKYNLGHSSLARLSMWKSVFLYRIEDPITPQGFGRFLFGKSIEKVWKDKKENLPYIIFPQAHNDFITILFSLGIFGLILFILFLSYNLKIAYYIFKNSEKYRPFAVFVFLGTVGYIASMMFGSFFGDSEQLYFYLLYGMLLAFYLKTKEENIEKTKIYQSK